MIPAFIQVELEQERETKNMVLYRTPGEQSFRGTVPNLYVKKTALASAFSQFPARIKVTIEIE